jgi:hypothetical protein
VLRYRGWVGIPPVDREYPVEVYFLWQVVDKDNP